MALYLDANHILEGPVKLIDRFANNRQYRSIETYLMLFDIKVFTSLVYTINAIIPRLSCITDPRSSW